MGLIEKLRNTFFLNTLIILISGFFVKALGLLNKIFITRLLGHDGMSIYILCFPTILLFINIASLNLNVTTSKLISESLKSQKYSPKKIINSAIKIALKFSIIVEIIYILMLRTIVFNFLKKPDLFYPLLTILFLIPLVGVTDTLRGLFAGYKKMHIVAKVNLLEQITRILFSIISLVVLSKYGIILSVSFTILALTIGEASSLIYLIFKLKKLNLIDFKTSNEEKKAILNMAIPTTLSKLFGSFTYFLEPILNTFILVYLGYNLKTINSNYTTINAYVIPLITITSFLSSTLATTLVPSLSENNASGNKEAVSYLLNKIFMFCIVPGIIFSILIFLFPKEFMNLFFATFEGTQLVKKYIFIFIIHYLQVPGIASLQALGKSKLMFLISSIFNVLRLIFIIIFAFIPQVGTFSIFYAILITMSIETLIIWLLIKKITLFKLNLKKIFLLTIISILTYFVGNLIIELTTLNYLIICLIILFTYSFLIAHYHIIEIKSLNQSILRQQ